MQGLCLTLLKLIDEYNHAKHTKHWTSSQDISWIGKRLRFLLEVMIAISRPKSKSSS